MWYDLATGRLKVMMAAWSAPTIAVNLGPPPGRLLSARVTVVIDLPAHRLSSARVGGTLGSAV